jgi:penicillin-binding protein 2
VSALTQSCDTWFYQVGIKIGAKPIVSYSQQLGLGHKTGIPLSGEADGVIPSDEYLAKRHLPKLLSGDLANLSIGQGYMEVTPLQLAEAMGSVGNGGTVFQTRLVQQVQGVDGQVVNPYNIRMRQQVDIDRAVMKNIRRGMVDVVSSGGGTAHQAQVKNVEIAGKTGTAQWGPKNRERTAAWFAGFAPADNPRYAFAVVYEGDAGLSDIHGGTFAAPIAGKVMGALFKNEKPQARKHRHDDDADDDSSSDDHSDDEAPVHHSRPEQPAPTPPPAPKKVPFWKRLFG